jgi:hypothetical protein
MVIIHTENVNLGKFAGNVVDIETVGDFDPAYRDSRNYRNLKMVIFGRINQDSLKILCAKCPDSISDLEQMARDELNSLEKPLYAFNNSFERSIFFHRLGMSVEFDGELQQRKYEAKREAVALLNLPQHGDPFNDVGKMCSFAWQDGDLQNAIAHNRACLLKEASILVKRGFKQPEHITLTKMSTTPP